MIMSDKIEVKKLSMCGGIKPLRWVDKDGNDMFPETSEPVRDADILKGILGKPKN